MLLELLPATSADVQDARDLKAAAGPVIEALAAATPTTLLLLPDGAPARRRRTLAVGALPPLLRGRGRRGRGADGGWRRGAARARLARARRRALTLARLSWARRPHGSSGDVALTLDNLVERAERRKRGECAAAGTALLRAALCDDGASGGAGPPR